MTINNFLEKAKKTAIEVKESNTTAKILDQAQKTAHSAYEQANKAIDFSREKATETLDAIFREINGLLPILHECGFIMSDLNFSIAIPPECTMTIEHIAHGHTSLEQILNEGQAHLSKLQNMALAALLKANEMVVITQKYGYVFSQYDLELTIPPKVTIHLVSSKDRSSPKPPSQPAEALPPST